MSFANTLIEIDMLHATGLLVKLRGAGTRVARLGWHVVFDTRRVSPADQYDIDRLRISLLALLVCEEAQGRSA